MAPIPINCFLLLLLSICFTSISARFCTAPECIQENIVTQANCTYYYLQPPTSDCRWKFSLDYRVDEVILGGRIVAFRLQWFAGTWSSWFVPGINDIDPKFSNTGDPPSISCNGVVWPVNEMRRWWSYFYDHTHEYILCKSTVSYGRPLLVSSLSTNQVLSATGK